MEVRLGTHRYKPSLMRQEQEWHVDAAGLSRSAPSALTLSFSRLTDARLVTMQVKGQQLIRLELTGPDGRAVLGLNTAATAREKNDQLDAYLAFLEETLDCLALARPDLQIAGAERPFVRWALFSIGASAIATATCLAALAVTTGVDTDRLVAAAVPLGAMVVLGLLICLNIRPWHRPVSQSPEEVKEQLARIGQPAEQKEVAELFGWKLAESKKNEKREGKPFWPGGSK